MSQEGRAAGGEPPGGEGAAGLSALERVQRELAETRSTLQGEASQISQLQDALETALQVARGVRLEALSQLDRLAGELMEAARRDAATIRAAAEAEAERLRAEAQTEAEAIRAAAEADAAEDRAEIARRLRAAQAELDRIAAALADAVQSLHSAREGLFAGADELLASAPTDAAPRLRAEPAPPVVSPPPAASPPPDEVAPPASAPRPLINVDSQSFPPQAAWPPPGAPAARPREENTEEVLPARTLRGVETPPEPAAAAVPEPAPVVDRAPAEPAPPPAEAPAAAAAAVGGALDNANQQLAAGDVPGALDTMRTIVDRQPEQVEPVIARLTGLLQDQQHRAHYEEVRLLLVDAYMVQGDYDRAMSLLHEPSS